MSLVVRDEIDLISSNIEFHAAQGVDVFVVMDNGSKDGTRERLEQLRQSYDIELVDQPATSFLQNRWATELAEIARHKHKADYIISNDADEFWLPKTGSLKDHLTQPVTKVRRTNMLPLRQDILAPGFRFFQSTLNVVRPIVHSQDSNRDAADFPILLRNMPGKVMCKIEGLEKIGFGNHNVVHEAGAPVSTKTIRIYHFPVRRYEDFAKRVAFERDRQRDTDELRAAGWHKRKWFELLERGELKDEWLSFSLDQERAAELTELGVISAPTRSNVFLQPARAPRAALLTSV